MAQLREMLETSAHAKPGKGTQVSGEELSPAVIDPTALEQIRALQSPDNPNLLGRIITMFVENSTTLTTRIRAALEVADSIGLREAAHALKSSSGHVGATRLAEIARQIEALGKEDSLDSARLFVEPMEQEHRRVLIALQSGQLAA